MTRTVSLDSKYGVQYQSDRAYEVLRDAVLEGQLKPGDQLNERVIGEKFGLGRTPLRHAFARLISEGLLDQIRHVGVFVRKLSVEEGLQLMEARRVLEAGAAAHLAEIADREQIAQLLALGKEVDELRETGASSESLLAKDRLFHQRIIDLSNNDELARVYKSLYAVFFTLRIDGKADFSTPVFSHSDIARSIASGDASKAFSVMWSHLGESVDQFAQRWKIDRPNRGKVTDVDNMDASPLDRQ